MGALSVRYEMGLKGGEGGVKAQLQLRFPRAFRRYPALVDARDGVLGIGLAGNERRDATALFLDGNVLCMAVPESACTFDAFCHVVFAQVLHAMKTASLVIVVFDEPDCLTGAKKEEQARRDAARSRRAVVSSADIGASALPACFSREELRRLADVHVLKSCRATRVRLYDEVALQVMESACAQMRQWTSLGLDTGTLLLDGVDCLGYSRPETVARCADMVGTHAEVRDAFRHTKPVGEGDIKLLLHETRLRELVSGKGGWEEYRLAITCTIDTDAFATSLLDVSKRRIAPHKGALHALFAMREPPTKREREAKADVRATFLCCDPAMLEGCLQEHIWAQAQCTSRAIAPVPSADSMLAAMLSLVAAAAVCGCDFTLTGAKGSRFDHFLEALPLFVVSEPRAVDSFLSILTRDTVVARQACDSLHRLCVATAAHMRTKARYAKQAEFVSTVPSSVLSRSVWAVAYWGGCEFDASADWGFESNEPVLCAH